MVVRAICPGEGCEFTQWLACGTIPILSEERLGAPQLFALRRGELFTALTGNLHVEQAGMIVFPDTLRIPQPEYGAPLTFIPADTLYPLYYEGEGSGSWWIHGHQDGGDWFFPDDEDELDSSRLGVLARPLLTRWWVRIRNHEGKEGWLTPERGKRLIVGIAPHYEEHPLRCQER